MEGIKGQMRLPIKRWVQDKMGWLFSPQHRLSVLLTCFLALLAVFLFLVRTTPEGQRWLSVWQAHRHALQIRQRFQEALTHDPPIGFKLADMGIHHSLISNHQSLPLLLVVFGSCEGCGAGDVREWTETLGNWKTWQKEISGVLVFREKAEGVKEAAKRGKWEVAFIADEDGKISKVLNAFFTPRAYGFLNGRLIWLQKEPNMGIVSVLENFLKATKGEGKARALLDAWSEEMREKRWGKEIASPVKGGDRR